MYSICRSVLFVVIYSICEDTRTNTPSKIVVLFQVSFVPIGKSFVCVAIGNEPEERFPAIGKKLLNSIP